ncbi:MAG: PAS domain-containing protein, partial [Proteobacteria bacterium]
MKLPPIIDTTYGLHSCRLLIVTSNEVGQESEFLRRVRELCQGAGHWELDACFSLEASFKQLSSRCYDVVLIDGSESLPLSVSLEAIQERQPAVVVIAFAETIKQDEYAALFERGLQDLLTPEHLMTPVLKSSILNAVSRQRLVTHLKSKNSILQRRLEDQVGYLKKVINGTHDGVIIIDQQGIVRLANPAAVDLFDRNQGELLGSYFGYPLANERPIELTIESQKRGLLTAEMRVARIE